MISRGAPHSYLRRRVALKGSNSGTWKMNFHLLKSFIPMYMHLKKMYVITLLLMKDLAREFKLRQAVSNAGHTFK